MKFTQSDFLPSFNKNTAWGLVSSVDRSADFIEKKTQELVAEERLLNETK